MNKKLITIIIFVIIFIGCKKTETIKADNIIKEPNNKTELLNNLEAQVLKKPVLMFDAKISDLNGKTYNLNDFKGNVIFLNLWATWCPPCRAEMPDIQRVYEKIKSKNFIIIAVSQDEKKDSVKPFAVNNNYTFPIYYDINNEVGQYYGSGSIPTTFVIDKKGYLVARFIGGRPWDGDDFYSLIEILLNEK